MVDHATELSPKSLINGIGGHSGHSGGGADGGAGGADGDSEGVDGDSEGVDEHIGSETCKDVF